MPTTGGVSLVDPTASHGVLYRSIARFSATALGGWLSQHVSWKIDPFLLRRTGGRLSTAWPLRVALLETTGARTGRPRAHPVIYFNDSAKVVIIASYRGEACHPAWFHNLVANPNVRLNGIPYRASAVHDDGELNRLWRLADNVFPPYATYRERAAAASGRVIPILHLEPA